MSIASILAAGGCANGKGKPTKVILKHPVTQDFVNCDVDKWQSKVSYEKNEECIKAYEAEGYEIWGKK